MQCLARHNSSSITRTELLVLVVGCAIGMAFLVVPKRKPCRMSCANNLRMDGIAIAEYVADHNGMLPHSVSTNEGGSLEHVGIQEAAYLHYRALAQYFPTPLSVHCPQDTRQPATDWSHVWNSNISYFYGLDSSVTLPRSMLMGDRNISGQSGRILDLRRGADLGWVRSIGLHGAQGNVLFGDGSVEMLTSEALRSAITKTGTESNRVAVP